VCDAPYRYPVRVLEQEVIFGAGGSQLGEPMAEESAEVWKSLHGHLSRSLACQCSWRPLQTRVLADLGAGGQEFESPHPDHDMQLGAGCMPRGMCRMPRARNGHPCRVKYVTATATMLKSPS
jgi:hypothetical protein